MKKMAVLLAILVLPSLCFAKSIDLYGHRGAAGLAPENTIPAYRTAFSLGVDFIDMDVGVTKDGVVVVSHDSALNPAFTRDAKGQYIKNKDILIKDLTIEQVQQYDVGKLNKKTPYGKNFPAQLAVNDTHMPTLDAVIDYAKSVAGNKIHYQIELKTDPDHPNWTVTPEVMAEKVVAVIKQNGIEDQVEVESFDWRNLVAVQQLDPKIKTSYLTDVKWYNGLKQRYPASAAKWYANAEVSKDPTTIPKAIKQMGGKVWCSNYEDMTPELVKLSHDLGLRVVVWTVDTPAAAESMIDAGVDGIISNRPDIVRGILAARGYDLPKPYLQVRKAAKS